MVGKLEGKVALITGAGRGIGRALALKLAADGARIVAADLDEAPAAGVVREIEASGGQAVAFAGNVADAKFGDEFVAAALTHFSGLDIIVSNAGYTLDAVIQKMSDDQFQKMIDVHVTAPFRILRAAAEPIRMFAKKEADEGREVFRKVVLISSMSGTNGNAGQVNYSSAKSALVGMTKTMSKEWGRYKVNVNCVAFGFIDTRLTKAFDDPQSKIVIEGQEVQAGVRKESLAMLPALVPLGRAGSAEEAAGGVYLFCIPESNYVSGQILTVGGGISF